MTVFAYCLATSDVDAKLALLSAAQEVITEQLDGYSTTPALDRPAFRALRERLVEDDVVLMPTLLDAGKDEIDVHNVLSFFIEKKIKLVIHELSDSDLTSSRELLKIVGAYSEFQTARLVQRFKNTAG